MDFAALDWFQYLNLRSNAFPQRVVGYHIQLGVDFYKKNPGGYFSVNNVFVAETATLFYDIATTAPTVFLDKQVRSKVTL